MFYIVDIVDIVDIVLIMYSIVLVCLNIKK